MLKKLTHSDLTRLRRHELSEVDRHPVIIIAENVRSAYNVGSILRTCDAALVEQIIVTGYTPDPDHPKVAKTALGAELTVPWTRHETTLEAISVLRSRGYTIAALEITDKPSRIEDLEPSDYPLAMIVGNEVLGVSDEVIEQCDLALEIPQYGAKQSLNVAVAFGIAVMGVVERFRQTRPKRP
jgi:tRNA G18 (ribose-2'-O)-methylase SpoU